MSGIDHSREPDVLRPQVAIAADPDAAMPWAVATDPGPSHRHNEDRWGADVPAGVFALADGMGGYSAGEVAAEIAVRTVTQGVAALRGAGLSTADALVRAVSAAHAGIVDYARNRPECLGMATTVVAAALDGARLIVAHVGDSRAYRLRDGVLARLTSDHSIGQQMLDAGRVTEAQVRRLPARGILTRALGSGDATPQVDLHDTDWLDGDLLLLCSDGLTDALDDAAIASALAAGGAALPARARGLVAGALARGCTDDATVMLVGGGAPAPARSH